MDGSEMPWTTSFPGSPINREVHDSTGPNEAFKGTEYPAYI